MRRERANAKSARSMCCKTSEHITGGYHDHDLSEDVRGKRLPVVRENDEYLPCLCQFRPIELATDHPPFPQKFLELSCLFTCAINTYPVRCFIKCDQLSSSLIHFKQASVELNQVDRVEAKNNRRRTQHASFRCFFDFSPVS